MGGSYDVILVDSGANANCTAANLVKTLNLSIFAVTLEDENILRVGGFIKPVRFTTAPVRNGEFQAPQRYVR